MNKPVIAPRGPIAPRRPFRTDHHGITRQDDYAWLRAGNWQTVMRDPSVLPQDIRAHLEAENAYTAAVMEDTEALQATLFEEMKGRIKEDDSSVPAPDGPFDYYTRYITGGQQPLFCRRPRAGGEEAILIDGNKLAEGHAYFRIGQVAHSPDHKLMAYAVDTKGSEYFTAKIINADTGAVIAESITDSCGGLEWAADSKTLLYVWLDEQHRPRKLFAHKLGETVDHTPINKAHGTHLDDLGAVFQSGGFQVEGDHSAEHRLLSGAAAAGSLR